ncbi:hypothetical protein ACF061_24685 [Streptomyces sp. NPDC015220]|uniref:hypothetical protein n=1 Tax=Streptomyces sp. NPDC015220 TaxID=3364947 RepID=UPI0036F8B169
MRGGLTITDVNQRSFHGALPLPRSEAADIVVDGVAALLRLYRAHHPPVPAVPRARWGRSAPV